PDFWWHLRVGRWMAEHGRLPSQDLFTFTVPTHVWTDHEYLTEMLMWLAYSTLGLTALCIAFGLLTWAGFWLIYLQVRRQPFVIIGVGLAIAAVAGSPIWGPRAQMITFALSCLELYWLQGYLSGRSRAINFFPLVMAVWANLHGGWVVGFVWLGVALASEVMSWVSNRDNPAHRMHVRRLAIIAVVSAVAVAATPHFLSLYPYPFQTQGSEAQQRLIVEWASPNFHDLFLRPFEAMVFLVIAAFALRRPTLYQFLLTSIALFLALQSVRNVALFAAHPGVGTRMYIQYGWGGYQAYRFYPDANRRVFIFGEAALMGDPLLNEYQDVQTLRQNWKQVLDKYGVDYIVYNKGAELSNV